MNIPKYNRDDLDIYYSAYVSTVCIGVCICVCIYGMVTFSISDPFATWQLNHEIVNLKRKKKEIHHFIKTCKRFTCYLEKIDSKMDEVVTSLKKKKKRFVI